MPDTQEKSGEIQIQTQEGIHQQTAQNISNELTALGDVLGTIPEVTPNTAESPISKPGDSLDQLIERVIKGQSGDEPSESFREVEAERLAKQHPGAQIVPVKEEK